MGVYMKWHKRFALSLVVLLVFAVLSAPAQRRRTGRQSRVKTPVGTAAYIRISHAALFKEVGLIRSMIDVLDFGDKVFLTPEDFSSDSDYIEVRTAKSAPTPRLSGLIQMGASKTHRSGRVKRIVSMNLRSSEVSFELNSGRARRRHVQR